MALQTLTCTCPFNLFFCDMNLFDITSLSTFFNICFIHSYVACTQIDKNNDYMFQIPRYNFSFFRTQNVLTWIDIVYHHKQWTTIFANQIVHACICIFNYLKWMHVHKISYVCISSGNVFQKTKWNHIFRVVFWIPDKGPDLVPQVSFFIVLWLDVIINKWN